MPRVSGLKEIRQNLNKAKRALGRPMLRAQARAAAAEVRNQARQNVRVRTGQGRKGIILEERRTSSPTEAQFSIGARLRPPSKSAFYLNFQETGTKPHVVSVFKTRGRRIKVLFQTRKILRAKDTGKFLGVTVRHPGQARRPWLRPALDQASGRALQAALRIGQKRLARLDANG